MDNVCPICSNELSNFNHSGNRYELDCPRCGEFGVSGSVLSQLGTLDERQNANASGFLRENPYHFILTTNIDDLKNIKTPNVGEKADKLFLYLTKSFLNPGQLIDYDRYLKKGNLLSISWCIDFSELVYLVEDYLSDTKGYLEKVVIGDRKTCKITPKGWEYLEKRKLTSLESQIAFVAMWFNKKVKQLWEKAVKQGIEEAGYKAVRIDMKQHNNRIDDEIIATIRSSKFLVADFTGQRGGVYFESGLAIGLGLPVIWLCRKDELKKVHFDTRQYNFIAWDDNKLEDLKKAIRFRIEGTIGRGNYNPSND